jgi:hypothetical protein
MFPRFLRTFLRRSAALTFAESKIELLRCGYRARCSDADCHEHSATTIVRYLDANGNPQRPIVEMCDEHADQIRRQGHVRDLRGFP